MDAPEYLSALPPRVAALVQIMHAMQAGATLPDRVRAVLTTTVRELGLRGGTVRLLTPDRSRLTLVAAVGLSDAYLAKGDVELARSEIDRQVFAGQMVVVDDAGHDPRFQYPDAAAREGIRSVLALPLRFGPRIVGVLRVYADRPHHFSPEETAFLAAVADAAGASLENAKMQDALLAIAQAVNSSLELSSVLATILEQTVDQIGLRAGVIRLLDPRSGALDLAAAYGLSDAYLTKGTVEVARSRLDQQVLRGDTVISADVGAGSGWQYPDAAQREGLASAVSFPLRVHARPIGVMRVYSALPHEFTPREMEFLDAVAHLGGAAIENARLYEALRAQNKNLEADLQAWYLFVG